MESIPFLKKVSSRPSVSALRTPTITTSKDSITRDADEINKPCDNEILGPIVAFDNEEGSSLIIDPLNIHIATPRAIQPLPLSIGSCQR
ncbi:hypothetical protein ACTXT7_000951 [Hymenolepis weldensis]